MGFACGRCNVEVTSAAIFFSVHGEKWQKETAQNVGAHNAAFSKKNIVDDIMKPEKETKETGPVVQAKWQHS